MNKKIIYLMFSLFFLNLSMFLSASDPLGSYLQDGDEDNEAALGEDSLFAKKNSVPLPPLSSFPYSYPEENPGSLPLPLAFSHAYPEESAGSLPPASTFTHAYPYPAESITPSLRPLSLIPYGYPAGNTTSSLPPVSSFPYSSYTEGSPINYNQKNNSTIKLIANNTNINNNYGFFPPNNLTPYYAINEQALTRPLAPVALPNGYASATPDPSKVYGPLTYSLLNNSEKSQYTVTTSFSSSYEASLVSQDSTSELTHQPAMEYMKQKNSSLLSFSFPLRDYEKAYSGITEFRASLSFSFPETHSKKTSDKSGESQTCSTSSPPPYDQESKKRKRTEEEKLSPAKRFKGDGSPKTADKPISENSPAPSLSSQNKDFKKDDTYKNYTTMIPYLFQNENLKKRNDINKYYRAEIVFKNDAIIEKVFKKILEEKFYQERYANNFSAPEFYRKFSNREKEGFLIAIIKGTPQARIAENFNTAQPIISKFSDLLSFIFDMGFNPNRRSLRITDKENLKDYCKRIDKKNNSCASKWYNDFKRLQPYLVKYFDVYFPDLCKFMEKNSNTASQKKIEGKSIERKKT